MADPKVAFFERTEQLLESVGTGELVGVVTVEQDYAVNQHEGGWLNFMGQYGPKDIENHPAGGGPPPSKFLETPANERAAEFVRRLAESVLDTNPAGGLIPVMADIQEDLAAEVYDRAPVKDGVLRNSTSRAVYDDGRLVYIRPPVEGRR